MLHFVSWVYLVSESKYGIVLLLQPVTGFVYFEKSPNFWIVKWNSTVHTHQGIVKTVNILTWSRRFTIPPPKKQITLPPCLVSQRRKNLQETKGQQKRLSNKCIQDSIGTNISLWKKVLKANSTSFSNCKILSAQMVYVTYFLAVKLSFVYG